jgi:hypothetical protein
MRLVVLVMVAVSALLAGCPDKRGPLASAPFDASRKGRSVSMSLEVAPDHVDLQSPYMLGVFFRTHGDDAPEEKLRGYPPQERLYLRVNLWRLVGEHAELVPVADRDFDYDIRTGNFSYPPSMAERHTDIAYVRSHGKRRGVTSMEAVHFKFPAYGKYRIDVETIGDTAVLNTAQAWLTVQPQFSHGK